MWWTLVDDWAATTDLNSAEVAGAGGNVQGGLMEVVEAVDCRRSRCFC